MQGKKSKIRKTYRHFPFSSHLAEGGLYENRARSMIHEGGLLIDLLGVSFNSLETDHVN